MSDARLLEELISDPVLLARHPDLCRELCAEHSRRESLIQRLWRMITLGTHPTANLLCQDLVSSSYRVGIADSGIPEGVSVASDLTEIRLVRVTVAELGFPDGATRAQIYAAGLNLGWGLCPAEVGLQLRKQYNDQPIGESVIIAMEPIVDIIYSNAPVVLSLVKDDNYQWLVGCNGWPDHYWTEDTNWVFCCE